MLLLQIFENAPTNTGNNSLINCTDFNANGNTLKNSAEILDFTKHGQSNTELQALKNYILNTEAQMSAPKSHVKCELYVKWNRNDVSKSLGNDKFSARGCQ